ncbi:MAG: T9SS type A sorting domain-containing protein [Candidatus Kapabacteria bacterium]|nr:T9SS type A sorting domain-containing protein [Candidatus Kapabacteria bacterium]
MMMKNILKKLVMTVITFIMFPIAGLFAQNYELTLNQRRKYDQIHVEVWARALNANAPRIGNATLVVQYDPNFLSPASVQAPGATDSVNSDIDMANPIDSIPSGFNSVNGYNALGNEVYTSGYFSLELTLASLGQGGISPISTGKGSFVGKLIFNIISNPDSSSKTAIMWSKSAFPGAIHVFNTDSTEITSNIKLTDPADFNVLGITILSPNYSWQVVNLNKNYTSLSGDYSGGGYPIYFERSVNPNIYPAPITLVSPALAEDLGYDLEYSLDDGQSWSEIGRVTETDRAAIQVGNQTGYRSSGIFNPGTGISYTITTHKGEKIQLSNYRDPLRVIWKKNAQFIERSEAGKLKITNLDGKFNSDITTRAKSFLWDVSDFSFILGRLFFIQLDGSTQYLRTPMNIRNTTQLTVEAWVNLNSYDSLGTEPGILASSGGPSATQINGSKEGSWLLYLKDGRYPSFRVREISNRGTNGYIAWITSTDPLPVITDSRPLSQKHSKNWTHIAATVMNNEVTLYVNGEIVDKVVNTIATDIRMLNSNHPVWVGVNPNLMIDNNRMINAGLKGVRMWQTALTQDQIRKRASGVTSPSDVSTYGDLKRGLQLYYNFEGTRADLASDSAFQGGKQNVDYYINNSVNNNAIVYRPDLPHLKITAPAAGAGVKNTPNDATQIRWIAYGLNDIVKNVDIQYNIVGDNNWTFAKDTNGIGNDLANTHAPVSDTTTAYWEPYLNNSASADLRTINPYSHKAILRVYGSGGNSLIPLGDVSDTFTVAPHFSIRKEAGSIIMIPGSQAMNITGSAAYVEAWIRPYRFPTLQERIFPILTKMDSSTGDYHYQLHLMPSGQLKFIIKDSAGTAHVAVSDTAFPLVEPNSIMIDTAWTHIGVYFFNNGGSGQSDVRFYIDGTVQRDTLITYQLGKNIVMKSTNAFPTYIGYYPQNLIDSAVGFIGEIRDLRFWSGSPDKMAGTGTEPTDMTAFIQGAQSIRPEAMKLTSKANLHSSFSFDMGSLCYNGYYRIVGSPTNPNLFLRHYATPLQFVPVTPYIKVVEPIFKQQISNSKQDLKVRFVGFDYNGTDFSGGSDANNPPALEFSLRGGGGNTIQPYQYVGSKYWRFTQTNALTIPATKYFTFSGANNSIDYGLQLNISISDPDALKNGKFEAQGPLAASLTNARLRLTSKYTINSESAFMQSESPLFSITPSSNFTVRALLEGYHNGNISGMLIRNLPSSYSKGGIKIKLFSDNGGSVGTLLDSAESIDGYDERNPLNRNGFNNRFGNINFVFTKRTDGKYWVVVDQINHLPVMSRFAAPFIYEGDVKNTWSIESGWDFESWNGKLNNILPNDTANPWPLNYFTLYGDADTSSNSTGLVYNNGVAGQRTSPFPALIGGDVVKDGVINSSDRTRVRLDNGTSNAASDVTGDGIVNADDRTICDRNMGKSINSDIKKLNIIYSNRSIGHSNLIFPNPKSDDPYSNIDPSNPELSKFFNDNARIVLLNPSINNIIKNSNENTIQGAISFNVSSTIFTDANYCEVKIYLRNTGSTFAPANCTFGIKYNTSVLKFLALTGKDSVMYNYKPAKGYTYISSAPTDTASHQLPEVRTIEIDYDAFLNPSGIPLPDTNIFLGTLRFQIKNKNGVAAFSWDSCTSVHTTNGDIITTSGKFDSIKTVPLYSISLINPNGGESLTPMKSYQINWTTTASAQVYLEFSSDGGFSWSRIINNSILSNSKAYGWTIPDVSSTNCLVRIVDAISGYILTKSKNTFSILPSFAQIIHPSSGDPIYTSGKSDFINWVIQGYQKVKIEFSSNGGTSWSTVASTVDGPQLTFAWKIPKITTKTAYIRLLDIETGFEVARSGMFKILVGTYLFKNPIGGERISINSLYKVRWTQTDVTNFDLQLSLDNGINWNTLGSNIIGTGTYFNWGTGLQSSDMALMRAIYRGDPELEFDRTMPFTIYNLKEVRDDLPEGIWISSISPNPSSGGNISLSINSTDSYQAKYILSNTFGERIIQGEFAINNDISQLSLNTDNLCSGIYYLTIRFDKYDIIRKIEVIK